MASEVLSHLSNPLATPEQLSQSASSLDDLPSSLVDSIRYQGYVLTQSAGIVLRLPQDVIAQAIVTYQRFYTGPEGGSFRVHASKDTSAACLYLTAKTSLSPISPRSILNVYAYLLSPISPLFSSTPFPAPTSPPEDPSVYTLTPGSFQSALLALQTTEILVLRTLAFTTRTVTPHTLALTYLSTLGAFPAPSGPTSDPKCKDLVARTLAHLSSALASPQLLYLTHQAPTLAVAAIYLAAREVGVVITGAEVEGGSWWEVFDVGREELGFVVVALRSLEGWVRREAEEGRAIGRQGMVGRRLLSVEDVEAELQLMTRGHGSSQSIANREGGTQYMDEIA